MFCCIINRFVESQYGFVPLLNSELRRLGALCGQAYVCICAVLENSKKKSAFTIIECASNCRYVDPSYGALLSDAARTAAETVNVDVELAPHGNDPNAQPEVRRIRNVTRSQPVQQSSAHVNPRSACHRKTSTLCLYSIPTIRVRC